MKTKHLKHMLWNASGNLFYLAAQWLVTVLVARLFPDDLKSAGILSVAMSLSAVFQTIALFGMRNYQVSDINEKHSNSAYFCFRHITAAASLLLTFIAALLLQYRGATLLATILFMLFRIAECYSDVLHGMAQKAGRLDMAGKGFAIKAVALLLGFFAGFFLGKALVPALLGMLIGSLATTLGFDLPVAKHLSPFTFRCPPRRALSLARETLPLCVYFFLLSAISSLPKLVLEKLMDESVLGAYASIFAPALLIAGAAGYLYTPFIPTFAELIEKGDERKVRGMIGKLLAILSVLLLLLVGASALLGEWGLVLVFGETIRPYTYLLIPIFFAVFASAVLSFFCMLAVVRRRFLPLCLAVGAGAVLSPILSVVFLRGMKDANGASVALLVSSLTAILLLAPAVFRHSKRTLPEQGTTGHTFALCAYRESPYLEECVKSLLSQSVKSEIFISTATPCDHIRAVAQKYSLPLYINEGEAGITGDWNFAVAQVKTPYFTIAHQDDIYDPTFTERTLAALSRGQGILAFTDYYELRAGKKCENSSVQRVKRLLAFPLKFFGGCRFVRRRVLSLGNAVCCPAVTYVTAEMKDFSFDKRYAFVCDWDAFERLSRKRGRFYRIPARLMGHRIHEESATTALTASPRRATEELEMFCRFWPRPVARFILRFYAKGADSNDLKKDKTKK